MDTLAASSPALGFVGWEKVFLYGDGGRKKVHYYLKRRDGSSDLAVVGRKRSSKHMAYDYDIRNPSLLSISPSSAVTKLRSLGEVVDWLNSIVSGTNTLIRGVDAFFFLPFRPFCNEKVVKFAIKRVFF